MTTGMLKYVHQSLGKWEAQSEIPPHTYEYDLYQKLQ